MDALVEIQRIFKALDAGYTDAAPGSLVGGPSLQMEDLSNTMYSVTVEKKHLNLTKNISVETCKQTLAQFDRQLSIGQFGGGAQLEGNLGPEDTSDFVRITVPMCYYSKSGRVTIASTLVGTVDGKKSDDRSAEDRALTIACDMEFDSYRGLADFSNAGVFDGNPLTTPALANMHGIDLQVRQSDYQINSRDLMFGEFGSDDTVVIQAGGVTLTQEKVEDASVRSALNFGDAKTLRIDPISLSGYNKITFGKERIILAGSPQDATGGDLRRQWVSGGTVTLEASHFLRGKASPARPRIHPNAPFAPTFDTTTVAPTGSGSALLGKTYTYFVTAGNETSESPASASATATPTAGQYVTLTITPSGSGGPARYFNVYQGATAATAHFIGRVVNSGATTTAFVDLGNKVPGFVTGFLVDESTFAYKQLAPFTRLKMPNADLSIPEAYFQFQCLASYQPRHNVVVDNIKGQF
jgi:hypothetical protein